MNARHVRRELTRPAMLVALLALGMASVGTAFASGLIGSAQVRDNSLTSADIHDDTIASRDIKNLSLGASDIAEGSITSTKIKNGSVRAGDLSSDAVGRSQLANNSITAAAIAPSAVNASAIADGAVGARSLDPRLARVYQFGGSIDTDAPDRVLLERDGYKYTIRCVNNGAGGRIASLLIARTDGSDQWSGAGSKTHLFPNAGPQVESEGFSLETAHSISADTADNFGLTTDLFIGNVATSSVQRISALVSNFVYGQPRCAIGGTIIPLTLD